MLLTGELSLDGKASLLLCPFGRKSNNESCQYFDVSILCFFLAIRDLFDPRAARNVCSGRALFFLADQLFFHRL